MDVFGTRQILAIQCKLHLSEPIDTTLSHFFLFSVTVYKRLLLRDRGGTDHLHPCVQPRAEYDKKNAQYALHCGLIAPDIERQKTL